MGLTICYFQSGKRREDGQSEEYHESTGLNSKLTVISINFHCLTIGDKSLVFFFFFFSVLLHHREERKQVTWYNKLP